MAATMHFRPDSAVVPAGLYERGIAATMDGVVCVLLVLTVSNPNGFFIRVGAGVSVALPGVGWRSWVAAIALVLAYQIGFTAAWGQTLGKAACGLSVVRVDAPGDRVGLSAAVRRAISFQLVGAIAILGPIALVVATVVGHEHRGLHDRAAGTIVVASTRRRLTAKAAAIAVVAALVPLVAVKMILESWPYVDRYAGMEGATFLGPFPVDTFTPQRGPSVFQAVMTADQVLTMRIPTGPGPVHVTGVTFPDGSPFVLVAAEHPAAELWRLRMRPLPCETPAGAQLDAVRLHIRVGPVPLVTSTSLPGVLRRRC